MKIGFATSKDYPNLDPYAFGIQDTCASLNIEFEVLIWNTPRVDYSDLDLVVIHSVWDSHRYPREFLNWVKEVERSSRLVNSFDLVKWNQSKNYLKKLELSGIPIVPSEVFESYSNADSERFFEFFAKSKFIAKPLISADAEGVIILPQDPESAWLELITNFPDGSLVQPKLNFYTTTGERSYVYLDGTFNHGVLRPQGLESLLIEDFEPKLILDINAKELEIADRIISILPNKPVYARIDFVQNESGEPLVAEVELIEPCLFLSLHAGALKNYCIALKNAV